jgi:hypothetical protein
VEEEPSAAPEEITPADGSKKVSRVDMHAERAQKMAERFRVPIDTAQWSAAAKEKSKDVHRVEKPIRMRIHRHCHRCNTVFGGNKVCVSCEHVRCKNCPRSPPKKTEKKAKEAPVPVAHAIEPDDYWNLRDEAIVLTKPSKNPGAQPLVKKKPMQRVRRTCCGCASLFVSGTKTCATCSHTRCADCPRDP